MTTTSVFWTHRQIVCVCVSQRERERDFIPAVEAVWGVNQKVKGLLLTCFLSVSFTLLSVSLRFEEVNKC